MGGDPPSKMLERIVGRVIREGAGRYVRPLDARLKRVCPKPVVLVNRLDDCATFLVGDDTFLLATACEVAEVEQVRRRRRLEAGYPGDVIANDQETRLVLVLNEVHEADFPLRNCGSSDKPRKNGPGSSPLSSICSGSAKRTAR